MTFDEILSRLDGVTGGGNQRYARCPAHDDHKASLAVSRGGDGRVLLHCHAGCAPEQIVEAIGLTMQELFVEPLEAPREKWKVVARYNYTDASGKLLAQKTRYDTGKGKTFLWRHPNERGEWEKGRGGKATLYNPSHSRSDHVYLVEGEKDADALTALGRAALSPPDGAKSKWLPEYTEMLRGRVVAIIQDNDAPGKEFAQMAAKALTGAAKGVKVLDLTKIWPELPEHGDTSDLLEHMGPEGMTAISQLAKQAPDFSPEETKNKLKIIRMSEIEPKRAEYLLYPYLPRGKLTIIGGISGSTKTWLVLYLASVISNGTRFTTDDEFTPPRSPGVVIYQTRENDYETDIRPRLDKLGANLENIITIDDHDEDGHGFPLTLVDGRIEEAAEELHPALIVFDPIQSYIGAELDFHKANEVRPVLDKLIDLAKRYRCAVALISHMSKMTTAGALDRLLGTSDLRNAARSILVVGSDPNDPNYPHARVVAHAKNSLGRTGQSLRYHIDEYAGVVLDGFCELDEDTIIKTPAMLNGTRQKPSTTLNEAVLALDRFLGDKGAAKLSQIQTWAALQGISQRTLYNAKNAMELQTLQIGFSSDKTTWWLQPDVDKEKFRENPPQEVEIPPEQMALGIPGEWPPP